MKQIFSIVSAIVLLSCNNQTSNAKSNADSTTTKVSAINEKTGGGCANNLLFRKGAVIDATTYDGNGKVLGLQSSTVMKVYEEKGMTVSELDMKTTNAEGKDEKTIKAEYKCDGENFVMD